jgi:hypothetical protein
MNYRAAVIPILALALLACGGAPTQAPTTGPDEPQPDGQLLAISLASDSERYAASNRKIQLTAINNGSEPVYLPICGPWEIVPIEDPERAVWAGICEVDFLGHELLPGEELVDTLKVQLAPGAYQARVWTYGQCNLEEPEVINSMETNYGAFSACDISQQTLSPQFVVK